VSDAISGVQLSKFDNCENPAIAAALAEAKRPIKIKTIVVSAGVHVEAMTKHLKLLERNKLAEKTSKGAWMLTYVGKEAFEKRIKGEFGEQSY
jgi:predicted transcriptional regulator